MTALTGIEIADLDCRLRVPPRFPLAATPTPLEDLPRLAERLGLPRLLCKRDDLTGLAFGGNKVRVLEYVIGDALQQGCDLLIAGGGGPQSNHGRLCAAAARRAGMDCVLVLRGDGQAAREGNLLVTDLLGAEIVWSATDPEIAERSALKSVMDGVAARRQASGRRPYLLYTSVHPLGVLGYLRCAIELAEQLATQGISRAALFAASEGVVLAGLVLASRLLGLDWAVTGVRWRTPRPQTAGDLVELCERTCRIIGVDCPVVAGDFRLDGDGGPAYGVPSAADIAAQELSARTEGLLLDPVYTAKGMAGLVRAAADGTIDVGRTAVFLHTGGLPALFVGSATGPAIPVGMQQR